MNYIITVRICFYLEKCKYNFYQESIPIIFSNKFKKLTRHIPKQKMLKLIIVYCPFEACQMQVQVRQWLKDVKLTQAFCIAYVVFIVFQKVQYWILLSRFLRFTERKLKVFIYCSSLKSTVFFLQYYSIYNIVYYVPIFC